MTDKAVLAFVAFLAAATLVSAGAEEGSGANEGRTFAIIVTGISKEPQYILSKDGSAAMIRVFLTGAAKVKAEDLKVLLDSRPNRISDEGKSTAENIRKALQAFAEKVGPQDRLLFFYMGQANVVGEDLRLNLSGPDITAKALAGWLKSIEAAEMLIVLDCPGSGLAAKALSGAGRTVVCACEAEQHYSTQFSEYFVPALQDPAGDSNHDGRISVLEAFTSASRLVDDWYRQRKLLTTETPVLEDDGDGIPGKRPWRYETDGGDGRFAAQLFLIPEKR